jgi:hypothetical protein
MDELKESLISDQSALTKTYLQKISTLSYLSS